MKNVFLLIVAPVLLVTLGFGQTPPPSSNTDQGTLKGCLSGSEGNYTVAEDGTARTFKITGSMVDLKPHVGHDIEVSGQGTTAASSGSSNNFAVTAVNMISDHCAPAIASAPPVADTTPAATASTSTVTETIPTPSVSTPAAVAPAPIATASAPAAVDPTPAETTSAPIKARDTEPTAANSLPNTATPLPVLGFLGLGLLGLGLLIRRSRTNQG
jgi:hypothetical protein